MGTLRRAIDAYLERRQIERPDRELAPDDVWAHMRRHGDFPLAYSAVSEPYLKTFGDRRGFIAYAQKMGYAFALGDPYCAREDAEGLLADFVEAFRRPVFVAVSAPTAAILDRLGYRLTPFGHDSVIDLASHSFAGGEGKRIRYSTSWMKTNGLHVEERRIEDFPTERIVSLSQKWRRSRVVSRREIRFLNRTFEPFTAPDVRRFFAVDGEGNAVAFISFDPLYRDGRIVGYLASNKRRDPDGTPYLDLGIMRHAIDAFKAEGIETVWLGLSPLAPMETGADKARFRADPLLARFFCWAYRSSWVNRRIFSLEGIASYKGRFRGRAVPAWLATPPRSGRLLPMIALLRLIKLI